MKGTGRAGESWDDIHGESRRERAGDGEREVLRPTPRKGSARRLRGAMSVDDLARTLSGHVELGGRVTHWERIAAREARYGELPSRLDPALLEMMAERGRERFYEHQTRAIAAALDGHDVLVATPTASGKTMTYTLPVLQRLVETGGRSRSLWMFPTKALSQDQSSNLNVLLGDLAAKAPPLEDLHSFTYDGDTPPSIRRTLRERGHVVLTNPWMLHQGILPNHAKWSVLFENLDHVVIDEVHTLSGVFGSSVANVLRRLQRIARHYGSDPRFLLSSATLHDPAAHVRTLIGRDAVVVQEDGSPSGERVFAVYEPPILDAVAGLRANALEEARRLAQVVCGPKHQTIFFCNRRTSVEVLTRYLKELAPRIGLRPDEVRGYRGGYLPNLRREIETGLREGKVKVVVTTNALELGIDVGALDVAVLVGYPGSQASFWQRAGRVGRRGNSSLTVMIARSDPIDQYLAQHPDYLFASPQERLGLDPDNLVILSEQLKCAAFELPFRGERDASGDVVVRSFGENPHVAGILDYLSGEAGFLHRKDDTWHWMADAYPAQDVSLAGGEPDNVLVLEKETGKALGEVDREGALTTVHEGAIYQVEGETWKVERFDYTNRRAYVSLVTSDYFTEAQTDTEVRVLSIDEEAPDARGWSRMRGEVHLTTLATQYKKIRFYTRENVGCEDIALPPEEKDTEAFVLVLADEAAKALGLQAGTRAAAWSATGSLLRRVAPLYLRCQPQDLGLASEIRSKHFEAPTIYLYDRVQGGVGLSGVLFSVFEDLARAARDVVANCPCVRGCPACVGPLEEVGEAGKRTATALLDFLLGTPLEVLTGADAPSAQR
ncbi:MAG: DEAD/DEAH box helicase [Planctomycetota bacterium]